MYLGIFRGASWLHCWVGGGKGLKKLHFALSSSALPPWGVWQWQEQTSVNSQCRMLSIAVDITLNERRERRKLTINSVSVDTIPRLDLIHPFSSPILLLHDYTTHWTWGAWGGRFAQERDFTGVGEFCPTSPRICEGKKTSSQEEKFVFQLFFLLLFRLLFSYNTKQSKFSQLFTLFLWRNLAQSFAILTVRTIALEFD